MEFSLGAIVGASMMSVLILLIFEDGNLFKEASVGRAYMQSCISEGYTFEHCHERAMSELKAIQ